MIEYKRCPECHSCLPYYYFYERTHKIIPYKPFDMIKIKLVHFKTCFICFYRKNHFHRHELMQQ